ncbi:YceI family protein [Sulfurimonas sediminis]|uniref:YceI family protein n=1 Tax=Sulfurimonas sediminis TaxID=2590020 RepID=A0A7M1B1E8_9BACT|nr:YceI family protein [Sulfurimonas sediminis]QOP43597.1 YceI family protein [Sulfurimonas sediminis]
MKKIILALLLATASLYALEVQNTTIKFTAFKTYAKKGVSGVFDKIKINTSKADTVVALLKNATAEIETSSVNSGNKGRDAKLVTQFFNVQKVKKIEAKIIDVQKDILVLQLSMNSKTLNIPMSYTVSDNRVNAQGTIDLADFMMLKSLKSINKACYTLHKGKTWQDVNIYFTMQYK